MSRTMADGAEVERFKDEAVKLGFSRENFNLEFIFGGRASAEKQEISVSRTKQPPITKRYAVGPGTDWLTDAIADLKAGVFGKPG